MLIRKLFRTAWNYKAQFISMMIMIAIGIGIFLGFNIEWQSIESNTSAFFAQTNYADFRLYSENGFTQDNIQAIQRIDGVKKYKKIRFSERIRKLYRFHHAGNRRCRI